MGKPQVKHNWKMRGVNIDNFDYWYNKWNNATIC